MEVLKASTSYYNNLISAGVVKVNGDYRSTQNMVFYESGECDGTYYIHVNSFRPVMCVK